MITSTHPLRAKVLHFMATLPIPASDAGEIVVRTDGVHEYTHQWRVRGDWDEGLFASFADVDDVIEFGLLARHQGEARNVLHATVVLEAEEANLHVASEDKRELNFERWVTVDACALLDNALSYFAELVRAAHQDPLTSTSDGNHNEQD